MRGFGGQRLRICDRIGLEVGFKEIFSEIVGKVKFFDPNPNKGCCGGSGVLRFLTMLVLSFHSLGLLIIVEIFSTTVTFPKSR